MHTFSEIDARRQAAGITRKELYEAAGLHKETWRRTKLGKTSPNTKTLEKLTTALEQLEQGAAA
jgi:predicted transcriptional regulator